MFEILIFVNIIKHKFMEELIEDYTYIKFLDTAERDLAAVESLYRDRHNSQAVYLFQQSIEKSCKYIGLTFRFIQYDDLKRLGHNPHKVFKKLFNVEAIKAISNDSDFDRLEASIGAYKTIQERVDCIIYHLGMASDEILINKAQNQFASMVLIEHYSHNPFTPLLGIDVIEEIKKSICIPEIRPQIEEICEEQINKINYISICLSYQMNLSFLVWGIEENSRYPNYDTRTDPSGIYSDDSPLVKELSFFISIQKKCIEILRKYCSLPD